MANDKEQYRIFEHISDVDISEQDIYDYEPEVLNQLLIDHTMSAKAREKDNDPSKVVNIFWATNDYEARREGDKKDGYRYDDQIMPERIIGQNGRVIMPRVLKDKQLQIDRTKDKAEVFTPSWVCNAQNNLIDEAWFGRKDVFNHEIIKEDGSHSWIRTKDDIVFPEGDKQKTWKKYVTENRLEVTCGEAPYLVSRYDTTTGEAIPLKERIGLLDRKLRVVTENTKESGEWLEWARKAFMHTYGYEWQGDNLLLAREALLYSFIEYFKAAFPKEVLQKASIVGIARIISWNIWQMDGIKMVVPNSCDKILDAFGDKELCNACKMGKTSGHIGIKCLIRDWSKKKPEKYTFKPGEDPNSSPWQKMTYESLFGNQDNNKQDGEDDD